LRILSVKEEEKEYHPDCLLARCQKPKILQAENLASLT
jgi:hypothetical protein